MKREVSPRRNSGRGSREGALFGPNDSRGDEKFPNFLGARLGFTRRTVQCHCYGRDRVSRDVVVAERRPAEVVPRSMDGNNIPAMGRPSIEYVDWAIAQNDKRRSAYNKRLDTTKMTSNWFSWLRQPRVGGCREQRPRNPDSARRWRQPSQHIPGLPQRVAGSRAITAPG